MTRYLPGLLQRGALLGLAACVPLSAACADETTAPATAAPGGGGTGAGGAAGGGNAGAAGSGTGGSGASATVGGPFRFGVNFGYVPGFTDVDMATLARAAGVNGARLSFPESHFAAWGYGIELGDNQAYQELGVRQNVAFLSGPTREHSTAPAETPDWELGHFIPANLHTPIFVAEGQVNPDNYWASYVAETVATYRDYVRIYSVWNEPDWVNDWQVVAGWETEPPTADELPRFHGSIFDYVRMLRITSEVAKSIDPEVQVAVGGLGYASFFAAVLRYTDNPTDGSVDGEHPHTGGHYVDVVDIHYYPIFAPGSSDEGVDGLVELRDAFAAKLTQAGEPSRPFIVTESGAPRTVVDGAPGGELYARNYLLKAMVVAQRAGIAGIDWFALSDGESPATDAFAAMGLYEQLEGVGSVDLAVRTPTGEAYRTLGALLEGARLDQAATDALVLPAGVEAAVLRSTDTPDAKRIMVLWARTAGPTEEAAATVSLATEATWHAFSWDAASSDMAFEVVAPTGGQLALALDGTPRFYLEQ